MTKPLKAAIEIIIKNNKVPKLVLEIGSRQARNQEELADIRPLFPNSKYIGTDAQDGAGVDIVADAYKLPFENNSFDMVMCFETLEHADKPWLISSEIERVVKKSGVVLISSQQNFPIHMHPSDYFRFTPMGLKSIFPNFKHHLVFSISPPFDNEVKLNPQQVVLVGMNGSNNSLVLKIRKALRKNIGYISIHKPYRHRIYDCLRFIRRGLKEISFRQEIEFF